MSNVLERLLRPSSIIGGRFHQNRGSVFSPSFSETTNNEQFEQHSLVLDPDKSASRNVRFILVVGIRLGQPGINFGIEAADASQISQTGQFFNSLQTLSSTNPSEFKQLLSSFASQLNSAASQAGAGSSEGAYLTQLASQFQNVANGAPLSTLLPQQPSAQSLAVQAYLQVQQSTSNDLFQWVGDGSGSGSSDSSGIDSLLQSITGGSSSSSSNDLLSLLSSSSNSSGVLQPLLSNGNGSSSSDLLQSLLSNGNGSNSSSNLLQSLLSNGNGSSSSSSTNDVSSLFQSLFQQANQAVRSSAA